MSGTYSYRAAFKRFMRHPLGITLEDHMVQEAILKTCTHAARLAKKQLKGVNT